MCSKSAGFIVEVKTPRKRTTALEVPDANFVNIWGVKVFTTHTINIAHSRENMRCEFLLYFLKLVQIHLMHCPEYYNYYISHKQKKY